MSSAAVNSSSAAEYIAPFNGDYARRLSKIQQLRNNNDKLKRDNPILSRASGPSFSVSSADRSRSHSRERTFGLVRPLSTGNFRRSENDHGVSLSSVASDVRSVSAGRARRSESRISCNVHSVTSFDRDLQTQRDQAAVVKQRLALLQVKKESYKERLKGKGNVPWVPNGEGAISAHRSVAHKDALALRLVQRAWCRSPWPGRLPGGSAEAYAHLADVDSVRSGSRSATRVSPQRLSRPGAYERRGDPVDTPSSYIATATPAPTARTGSRTDRSSLSSVRHDSESKSIYSQESKYIALTVRLIDSQDAAQKSAYGVFIVPRNCSRADLIANIERQFNVVDRVSDICITYRSGYSRSVTIKSLALGTLGEVPELGEYSSITIYLGEQTHGGDGASGDLSVRGRRDGGSDIIGLEGEKLLYFDDVSISSRSGGLSQPSRASQKLYESLHPDQPLHHFSSLKLGCGALRNGDGERSSADMGSLSVLTSAFDNSRADKQGVPPRSPRSPRSRSFSDRHVDLRARAKPHEFSNTDTHNTDPEYYKYDERLEAPGSPDLRHEIKGPIAAPELTSERSLDDILSTDLYMFDYADHTDRVPESSHSGYISAGLERHGSDSSSGPAEPARNARSGSVPGGAARESPYIQSWGAEMASLTNPPYLAPPRRRPNNSNNSNNSNNPHFPMRARPGRASKAHAEPPVRTTAASRAREVFNEQTLRMDEERAQYNISCIPPPSPSKYANRGAGNQRSDQDDIAESRDFEDESRRAADFSAAYLSDDADSNAGDARRPSDGAGTIEPTEPVRDGFNNQLWSFPSRRPGSQLSMNLEELLADM